MIYPAAIHAPHRARKSPKNAFPLKNVENGGQIMPLFQTQASDMPTMHPPNKARNMPIITGFPLGSRRIMGDSIATHRGVVVTRTTELEMVVYSSEDIQVAKWIARKNPDANPSSNSLDVNFWSSGLYLKKTIGAKIILAINSR